MEQWRSDLGVTLVYNSIAAVHRLWSVCCAHIFGRLWSWRSLIETSQDLRCWAEQSARPAIVRESWWHRLCHAVAGGLVLCGSILSRDFILSLLDRMVSLSGAWDIGEWCWWICHYTCGFGLDLSLLLNSRVQKRSYSSSLACCTSTSNEVVYRTSQ